MHNTLHFTAAAYGILKQTVGSHPPESGAVIGAPRDDPNRITKVWFDAKAGIGHDYYTPSLDAIEEVLRRWAEDDRCAFAGIVHSHFARCAKELSGIDINSALSILHNNPAIPFLYMGVFHRGELFMYKVLPDGSTETVPITVDPEN